MEFMRCSLRRVLRWPSALQRERNQISLTETINNTEMTILVSGTVSRVKSSQLKGLAVPGADDVVCFRLSSRLTRRAVRMESYAIVNFLSIHNASDAKFYSSRTLTPTQTIQWSMSSVYKAELSLFLTENRALRACEGSRGTAPRISNMNAGQPCTRRENRCKSIEWESWVVPRASLNSIENRKISCHCWESNSDPSVVQSGT
jgi:hypothetical protein